MGKPEHRTDATGAENYLTPEAPKAEPTAKYRQVSTSRVGTYADARKLFEALPDFGPHEEKGKKRIKSRSSGHYDVVLFELAPPPKPKKETT